MNNFDEELIKKNVPHEDIESSLRKLSEGYPVQYIIGNVDFYDTLIQVNEDVLIPRFETEYLVDDLLKYLKNYNFVNPRILDIGTGSGCIAISIKKNIKSKIDAIDISSNAIELAKKNALNNNMEINFMNEDVNSFEPVNKYDVIVSNPPYVAYDVEVDAKTKYEPQNAIFASDNGLYFYKVILEKSVNWLNKKSLIAFEIGHNQASTIKALCQKYYPESLIIAKSDLNGFDRYIYVIND